MTAEIPHLGEAYSSRWIQNQVRQKTFVTDSANNPLAQAADQAPAGLDDLLASVISGEDEQPKKRGRKKKVAAAEPEPTFQIRQKLTLSQPESFLWKSAERHHAEKHGCLGIQGLHLRDAVPEAPI